MLTTFKALALLSFLAISSDAQCIWTPPNVVYCNGAAATTAYSQANPGAKSTACGAACGASFVAINAANASQATACSKAVADAKNNTAVAQNACNTMLLYVKASTDDANAQTSAACKAAITGTTACNAAYSTSYISCNVAHKTDYDSCNMALDTYVQACITSPTSCSSALATAQQSCQASALTAKNSCAASMTQAQSSC